jgi:Ca2+-binding EF-hand superfamily protein
MGLALLSACAAGVAAAQDTPANTPSPAFAVAYLDKDADGKVSLNEYLHFQLPKLAAGDANANGRLSLKEFESTLEGEGKSNADRSFRVFDQDKDKGLEQREFLGYHAYIFKTFLDADRDGFLTVEEFAALRGR